MTWIQLFNLKIIDSKLTIKNFITKIFVMEQLIKRLSKKAVVLSGQSKKELERTCWMIVHEHKHGVMPTEYDIREIDEELYLEVLKTARDMAQVMKRDAFYLLKMTIWRF